MNVERSESEGVTLLVLSGRLDSTTSGILKADAMPIAAVLRCRLVLDMSQVEYVSSAGLRVIMILAKQTRSQDGSVVVCSLTPRVREVFDISGFSRLVTLYESREEALIALRDSEAARGPT